MSVKKKLYLIYVCSKLSLAQHSRVSMGNRTHGFSIAFTTDLFLDALLAGLPWPQSLIRDVVNALERLNSPYFGSSAGSET